MNGRDLPAQGELFVHVAAAYADASEALLSNADLYGRVAARAGIPPLVWNFALRGSLCLNVSNDVFVPKSPSRSLYLEHLVLALSSAFHLAISASKKGYPDSPVGSGPRTPCARTALSISGDCADGMTKAVRAANNHLRIK